SCETVEYARTFLMSFCARPMVAAKIAVAAPMTEMTTIAVGDLATTQLQRAIRYTPAVTIVAAWISADTGVGPAIASGSQTNSGICADLPAAPTSINRVINTSTVLIGSLNGPKSTS